MEDDFDTSWMPFPCAAGADLRSVAPFTVTPRSRALEVCTLARIISSDLVVDLGSGDGSLLFAVAEATGAMCTGVELDPLLVDSSRELMKGLPSYLAAAAAAAAIPQAVGAYSSPPQVNILMEDLMETALAQYGVIIVFLTPWGLARLGPKLRDCCERGARICSYMFPLLDMPKRLESSTGVMNNLYLYELPAC